MRGLWASQLLFDLCDTVLDKLSLRSAPAMPKATPAEGLGFRV